MGDEIAYVVLPAGRPTLSPESLSWRLEEWKRTLPRRPAGGALIAYPWDLVEHNGDALRQDFLDWTPARDAAPVPAGVTVRRPGGAGAHRPARPASSRWW